MYSFMHCIGCKHHVPGVEDRACYYCTIDRYGKPKNYESRDIEDTDPTGSFQCFTEEEKEKLMKPLDLGKGIEEYITWGYPF